MINNIGHLVELEIKHDVIVNLCNIVDLKQNELEAEICLIKRSDSNSKGKNYDEWIKWLTYYSKEDLFSNEFKAFNKFCNYTNSCERTFSKLSFMKT